MRAIQMSCVHARNVDLSDYTNTLARHETICRLMWVGINFGKNLVGCGPSVGSTLLTKQKI